MAAKKDNYSEYAKVCVKAWLDPKFKEDLKKDPAKTLKAAGFEVPEHVTIHVHENSEKEFHFVIPESPDHANLSEEELLAAAGGGIYATRGCPTNMDCKTLGKTCVAGTCHC